mmetsp:Transcript_128632/g.274493  ORF Transcript_128632/g.274493 Transcript_128632/m.274493 type:complete len:225 (+) Transcript_128632:796-1470(+)
MAFCSQVGRKDLKFGVPFDVLLGRLGNVQSVIFQSRQKINRIDLRSNIVDIPEELTNDQACATKLIELRAGHPVVAVTIDKGYNAGRARLRQLHSLERFRGLLCREVPAVIKIECGQDRTRRAIYHHLHRGHALRNIHVIAGRATILRDDNVQKLFAHGAVRCGGPVQPLAHRREVGLELRDRTWELDLPVHWELNHAHLVHQDHVLANRARHAHQGQRNKRHG